MRKFTNLIKRFPRMFTSFLTLAMVGVIGVNAFAAPAVRIESNLAVANVTQGDTEYKSSVNAGYDEVIRVKLWYHNMEDEDSGKVANNLTAKINAPTQPGKTQVIRGTISADNGNTVNTSATVNLDRSDAYLEYIPGSAQWRHNAGTNENVNYVTTQISDNVATSGAGLRLENAKPCFNFEASVYVLYRVRVPAIEFNKQVSTPGNPDGWMEEVTIEPGDRVKFLFSLRNRGNDQLDNVIVGDVMPEGLTYTPGTLHLTNGNHPNGTKLSSDNIASGGVNLRSFAPGGWAYVTFEATADEAEAFECGVTSLTNTGVVTSDQTDNQTDDADIDINRECIPEGDFKCDVLNAKRLHGRNYEFTARADANDATIESYVFQFGDGESQVVESDGTQVVVNHRYANPGTYNARVTVRANVDGETQTDTGAECAVKIDTDKPAVQPPAKVLPETGLTSVIGAIFGTGSLAAAVRGWFISRRSLKNTLLDV